MIAVGKNFNEKIERKNGCQRSIGRSKLREKYGRHHIIIVESRDINAEYTHRPICSYDFMYISKHSIFILKIK